MASEKLRSIRQYLYKHGRYLDVARWNFHFEEGSLHEVLKGLLVYQNRDGGFGHGLEPDNQNPQSNPIAVWEAITLLRELGFPKEGEPILRKILNYLENTLDEQTLLWEANIPTNNDYPHAPWWTYEEGVNAFAYNPTAEFIGVILRFEDPTARLYKKALEALEKALPIVMESSYVMDSHELSNFLNLYRDLDVAGQLALLPEDFEGFLKDKVDLAIERNPENYGQNNYFTPPSRYITGKGDFFYPGNEEICDFYTRYLEDQVTKEGYWTLNWTWGGETVPDNAIRDWRSKLIVNNMLFIEGMVK